MCVLWQINNNNNNKYKYPRYKHSNKYVSNLWKIKNNNGLPYTNCYVLPQQPWTAVVEAAIIILDGTIYTVFQKSDAKIQITITMAYLIIINYPLSSFNYRLSGTNVANFNKIYHMVSEQQHGKYRLGHLLQKVLRMT